MKAPRPKGLRLRIPFIWWLWRQAPARSHVPKPRDFWIWRKWRDSKPLPPPPPPPPKPTQLFMYDDVTLPLIPKDAEAVAGYVDGRWRTFPAVLREFPKAKHLSICVFASSNAQCLDVEPSDATPAQAAGWIRRQHARGNLKPIVYTNAASGQALVDLLTKSGLKYGVDYMWWSAHYNPALGKHLCGPHCGFGLKQTAHATQFTDHADNKSLDESLCSPGFLP